MEIILLLTVVVAIVFLLYISIQSSFGVRFVLLTLSVYWFLGYVLRPVLLMYSQSYDIRSPINDIRLNRAEVNIKEPLIIVIVGCFIFCFSLLFQRKIFWSNDLQGSTLSSFKRDSWILTYGLTFALIAQTIELTPFQNPFSKSLAVMTVPVFCSYLWIRRELHLSSFKKFYFWTAGLTGTFTLAISSNLSKGIFLSPVIIYIWKLSFWQKKKIGLKKLGVAVIFSFILVAFFNLLQNIKLGTYSVSIANSNSDSYPWFLRPVLVLSGRFDAFPKIVDAVYAQGGLGGYNSWFSYVLNGLSWNPSAGRNEIVFGQVWNQSITETTVRGSRLSSVSTAQGMIAEGYIWSGFPSLIIECILLSFVFVIIGKCLEGNLYRIIFAFALINNYTVFEAGIVQLSSSLSGSIKIMMFLWVSKHISDLLRGRNEMGGSTEWSRLKLRHYR